MTTHRLPSSASSFARRAAGLLLAAAALGLVVPLGGQAGAGGAARLSPTLARDVDRLFARWNTTSLPGCTVGVSLGGEQVLGRAYGMADLEHGVVNRPDTIIEAGSVSKQLTAAAVLLLAQQGRISLDDPVRQYIPELPDYGDPITVRHLLTHTSGLRDWGFVEDVAGWPRTSRVYTHDHVLDVVSRQRALNYRPGRDFSYTNTGYNLAAILVSRVAGKPFADFAREAVFEPLGMTRTSWRDDYTRVVRDRAIGYTVAGDQVATNMPFENIHGNAGLLTTVGDLLRWNENMVHGKVGGRAFVETQLTRGRLSDGTEIPYALGAVYITRWRGVPEISHSGGTAGYRAWLARYPQQGLSVAVLCNAGDAPAWVLGRQVADAALGLAEPTPARGAAFEGLPLETVAGLYRNRRTQEALAVTIAERQLRVPGMGALVPISADALRAEAAGIEVTLLRDARGAVSGLRAVVSDEAREFERVEPARPSAADLQALAGTYASDEAEVTLTVAIDGGRPVLRRRPNRTFPLSPTYADGFASPIGHLHFLRDQAGKVSGFSLGRDRLWDLRFVKIATDAVKPRNQP